MRFKYTFFFASFHTQVIGLLLKSCPNECQIFVEYIFQLYWEPSLKIMASKTHWGKKSDVVRKIIYTKCVFASRCYFRFEYISSAPGTLNKVTQSFEGMLFQPNKRNLNVLILLDLWAKCTSKHSFVSSFFLRFYLFIHLREWEREKEKAHKSTNRGSNRQREREKQTPLWAGSPMSCSIPGPWDHDLSRRQTLNQMNNPNIPHLFLITE